VHAGVPAEPEAPQRRRTAVVAPALRACERKLRTGDALAGRAASVREGGTRRNAGGRGGFRWGLGETATRWAVTIPYPSAALQVLLDHAAHDGAQRAVAGLEALGVNHGVALEVLLEHPVENRGLWLTRAVRGDGEGHGRTCGASQSVANSLHAAAPGSSTRRIAGVATTGSRTRAAAKPHTVHEEEASPAGGAPREGAMFGMRVTLQEPTTSTRTAARAVRRLRALERSPDAWWGRDSSIRGTSDAFERVRRARSGLDRRASRSAGGPACPRDEYSSQSCRVSWHVAPLTPGDHGVSAARHSTRPRCPDDDAPDDGNESP